MRNTDEKCIYYIGKWKTLFLFILCGILAEIACSMILSYSGPVYGDGSSGGIFALIAGFAAGIIVSFVMVLVGGINNKEQKSIAEQD